MQPMPGMPGMPMTNAMPQSFVSDPFNGMANGFFKPGEMPFNMPGVFAQQ